MHLIDQNYFQYQTCVTLPAPWAGDMSWSESSVGVEQREWRKLFLEWLTGELRGRNHCTPPFLSLLPQYDLRRFHMMQQLLDLSLLKVEEISSALLGRWRSLLERRRMGLGLLAGCSLFMQARAAVRKTLWMLFSDVKAEHSRYVSAPSCLAKDEPYDVKKYILNSGSVTQRGISPRLPSRDTRQNPK